MARGHVRGHPRLSHAADPDPLAPPDRPAASALRDRSAQDVMEGCIAAARTVGADCGAAPRICAAPTSWPPRPTAVAGNCCSATTSTALCRRSRSCSTKRVLAERKRAGPRARRRRPLQRDADRVVAAVAGQGRAGAVRLRVAQRRRRGEVRADQGSARPRDARSAVRRDEARRWRTPPTRTVSASTRCSTISNDLLDKHARGEDTQQDF